MSWWLLWLKIILPHSYQLEWKLSLHQQTGPGLKYFYFYSSFEENSKRIIANWIDCIIYILEWKIFHQLESFGNKFSTGSFFYSPFSKVLYNVFEYQACRNLKCADTDKPNTLDLFWVCLTTNLHNYHKHDTHWTFILIFFSIAAPVLLVRSSHVLKSLYVVPIF